MKRHLTTQMRHDDVLELPGRPYHRDGDSLTYGVGLRGSCEFLYLHFGADCRLDRWDRYES